MIVTAIAPLLKERGAARHPSRLPGQCIGQMRRPGGILMAESRKATAQQQQQQRCGRMRLANSKDGRTDGHSRRARNVKWRSISKRALMQRRGAGFGPKVG